MPIYEYECQECGHRHEALQKVSDVPLSTCPECHAEGLKKLISAAGFRLSGSGWYETDFKSGNQKNLATQDADKSKDKKDSKKKKDSKDSSGDNSAAKSSKKSPTNAS